MIDLEKRNALIEYRIQQSEETLKDAEILINSQRYRSAVNRIYYSVFYMLLALGLKYEFETSKHLQLIGWFNKNFIHTNLIPVEFGKFVKRIFECRTSSDYDDFVNFEEDEVLLLFNNSKLFIETLQNFMK